MATIAIQSLNTESPPPPDISIRGLVTLSWPYSSSTRQCALLIADPDFRLRTRKGQVRVRFTGPSAEAVAEAHVGIGDEVVLHLRGASWAADMEVTLRTPGRSVDGELLFGNMLALRIVRGDGDVQVEVDALSPQLEPERSLRDVVIATPLSRNVRDLRSSFDGAANDVGIYSSPAFTRRSQLSFNAFLNSTHDPFLDDEFDGEQANKRQRTSFGAVAQWRYAERSLSPEKLLGDDDIGSVDAAEDVERRGDVAAPIAASQDAGAMASGLTLSRDHDGMEVDDPMSLGSVVGSSLPISAQDRQDLSSIVSSQLSPPAVFGQAASAVSVPQETHKLSRSLLQAVPESASSRPSLTSAPAPQVVTSRLPDPGTAFLKDVTSAPALPALEDETSGLARQNVKSTNATVAREKSIDEFADEASTAEHNGTFTATPDSKSQAMDHDKDQASSLYAGQVESTHEDVHRRLFDQQPIKVGREQHVLPSSAKALPSTPTKEAFTNFGLDGPSSAKSEARLTPQSEREKVMAQTFRSLFGFTKAPVIQAEPTERSRSPSPVIDAIQYTSDDHMAEKIGDGTGEFEINKMIAPSNYGEDYASPRWCKAGLAVTEESESHPALEDLAQDSTVGRLAEDESDDLLPGIDKRAVLGEDVVLSRPRATEVVDLLSSSDVNEDEEELDADTAGEEMVYDEEDRSDSGEQGGVFGISLNRQVIPTPSFPLGVDEASLVAVSEYEAVSVGTFEDVDALQQADTNGADQDIGSAHQAPQTSPAQRQFPPVNQDSHLEPETEPLVTPEWQIPSSPATNLQQYFDEPRVADLTYNSPVRDLSFQVDTTMYSQPIASSPRADVAQLGSSLPMPPGDDFAMTTSADQEEAAVLDVDGFEQPFLNGFLESGTFGRQLDDSQDVYERQQDPYVLEENISSFSAPTKAHRLKPAASTTLPQQSYHVSESHDSFPDTQIKKHVVHGQLPSSQSVARASATDLDDLQPQQPAPRSPSRDLVAVREAEPLIISSDHEADDAEDVQLQMDDPASHGERADDVSRGSVTVSDRGASSSPSGSRPVSPTREVSGTNGPAEASLGSLQPDAESQLMHGSDASFAPHSSLPPTPAESQSQPQTYQAPLKQAIQTTVMPFTPQLTATQSDLTAMIPAVTSQESTSRDVVETTTVIISVEDISQSVDSFMGGMENRIEHLTSVPPSDRQVDTGEDLIEAAVMNSAIPEAVRAEESLTNGRNVPTEGVTETMDVDSVENGGVRSDHLARGEDHRIAEEEHQGQPSDAAKVPLRDAALAIERAPVVNPTEQRSIRSPVAVHEEPLASSESLEIAQKKTPARKSIKTRLSNVPDVISAWFSPKHNSTRTTEPPTMTPTAKRAAKRATKRMEVAKEPDTLMERREVMTQTPALSNGVLTSMSYFTSLSDLSRKLNFSSQTFGGGKTVDVLAVVADHTSVPKRAEGGPRDFYTTFQIVDVSSGKAEAVRVEVYRPWKAVLPVAKVGDVVLLRSFTIKSRKRQAYLLSTDASAWCAWRYSQEARGNGDDERYVRAQKAKGDAVQDVHEEVKGPPVELGMEERRHAKALREWWLSRHDEDDHVGPGLERGHDQPEGHDLVGVAEKL
ncbi:hypothetical protein LTR62_008519 [Meristemomyces frigidus]|uniref:Telomeric single stranded DNA binding POT1/Cdc13 domain-containing protein n=1 Tax=Meristemomyces frigidus TaxID=1508187 RepID=A0AAN7YSZ1_9PEZI|nr:hypothetical protein LTR62_008519 [Meristemomyces frigidus]